MTFEEQFPNLDRLFKYFEACNEYEDGTKLTSKEQYCIRCSFATARELIKEHCVDKKRVRDIINANDFDGCGWEPEHREALFLGLRL